MNKLRWGTLVLLALAAAAHGQYKYTGPDGTVTYSDQPPPASVKNVEVRNFATGTPTATMPFEVRQAATRFPVTLYTTPQCAACEDARKFMRTRGVPYTEKTVSTQEDLDALKKLSKDTILPIATVGRQKVSGFNETSWAGLLDDAGYPNHNELPPTYQNPAPEPLVPQNSGTSSVTADSRTNPPPPAASSSPLPAGNAPPGFHF